MKAKSSWVCAIAMTLSGVSPLGAQAQYGGPEKTDVLLLRNGDSFTGELKGLQRGLVTYSTDAMSTVSVKWPRVITATSDKQFEIHLADGRILFGSLKASDMPHRIIVRGTRDTVELPTQSVVALTRLGAGFWQRFSGSLSLGADYTQQGSSVDLSTAATIAYAVPLHRLELTFNGSFSRQDGASTISRRDAGLWWAREYSRVWLWNVAAQFQENSQLSLDFSFGIGAGPGRFFIDTNRVQLLAWIGPFFRRENYENEDPRTAVPLALATDFELFNWAGLSTDLSSRLVVAPVLNDAGRWQIAFVTQLKRELLNNFYLNISLNEYFDSNPPADANKNDFSINTSLSWTFGSGLY